MVRDRTGDDAATPYFSSTFINRTIDERVLVHATGKIVRLDPSFYMKEETITSVASQADYTVATDFGTLVRVERRYGSSAPYTYVEVPVRIVEDQATQGWVTPILALPDTISRSGKTFSLFGTNKYRIDPVPVDTTEVYRVRYLRRPVTVDLTNGAEVMDIPDAWGSYLALDVCKVLFGRRGDPRYGRVTSELREEYVDLRKMARRRTIDGRMDRLEKM